jgi:hypothetical protein
MNFHSDVRGFVKTAVKENVISPERSDRRCCAFCYSLLAKGWKHYKKTGYKKWFNNLKNNGYFLKNGKIDFGCEETDALSISFVLMMLVAKGKIERVETKCKSKP